MSRKSQDPARIVKVRYDFLVKALLDAKRLAIIEQVLTEHDNEEIANVYLDRVDALFKKTKGTEEIIHDLADDADRLIRKSIKRKRR